MTAAEQLTDPVAQHGEGPVWWPDGHLRFVDMLAGDLLDLQASGEVTRTHVATVAAVVRPRCAGGAVVAGQHGLLLLSENDQVVQLPEVLTDPSVRFNEGGCDPQGRFYCGSMSYAGESGAGRFFRFDADGSAEVVLDRVTVSNGFAFAPQGDAAYYVDSPTQRVDVFDYDRDAGLTDRRPFVTIDLEDGSPDGMTVDAEGAVWVAWWGAGAVRRFAADGSLTDVVDVPGAIQVTACTLGGARLDHLYITTSRLGIEPASAGPAGAIYVVDDVVCGLPVQAADL